jgi:hypothetical protein
VKLSDLSQPLVRAAIEAANTRDQQAWYALFAEDATLTDDGSPEDFRQWSENELFGPSQTRITAIHSEKQDGTVVHADLRSDRWGDFQTFWKFTLANGKITRLEVGQE